MSWTFLDNWLPRSSFSLDNRTAKVNLNALGDEVTNEVTDENGAIPQQTLYLKFESHAAGAGSFTFVSQTPHKVRISKSGYITKELLIEANRAYDEIEILENKRSV